MEKVNNSATNLMHLVTHQKEWMWANSPMIMGSVTAAKQKVDAFLNSSEFWRQWTIQENFKQYATKMFPQCELNDMSRMGQLSSDLDGLDSKVTEIIKMHNVRCKS